MPGFEIISQVNSKNVRDTNVGSPKEKRDVGLQAEICDRGQTLS